MNVGVEHAGQCELAASVDHVVGWLRRKFGALADSDDAAILDDQRAVADDPAARVDSDEVVDIRNDEARHWSPGHFVATAAALASEASGQRGNSISARAGHSPEPGSSARPRWRAKRAASAATLEVRAPDTRPSRARRRAPRWRAKRAASAATL